MCAPENTKNKKSCVFVPSLTDAQRVSDVQQWQVNAVVFKTMGYRICMRSTFI